MRNFDIKLTQRPFEKVTDEILLTTIAKKSNPIDSGNAFNEFYFRYNNYVWKVCLIACGHHVEGLELAKDIFQCTFIKVETRAVTYKTIFGIKPWLGRIAKNELINYFRKRITTIPYEDIFEEMYCDPDSGDEPSFNRQQIESALAQLKERERDVIRTYFRHYDWTSPNNHLPDYEIKYLCDKHKINKPAHLRKIKERALLKLENYLKK